MPADKTAVRARGRKAELRYQFIQENARFAEDLDI
jgi:hypothetical protein